MNAKNAFVSRDFKKTDEFINEKLIFAVLKYVRYTKKILNWIKLYVKTELSLIRIIIYSRNLKRFIKEKPIKKEWSF